MNEACRYEHLKRIVRDTKDAKVRASAESELARMDTPQHISEDFLAETGLRMEEPDADAP